MKRYLMACYQYNLPILRMGVKTLECKCKSIFGHGHGLVRTSYAGVNTKGGLVFPWKQTSDPLELRAMNVAMSGP